MTAPAAPDAPAVVAPAFGTRFTRHMATATWHRATGWSPLSIEACAAQPMHPAAAVLHYGQSVFEGAKAFRAPSGAVHLFRADDHAARMRRSARRMAMPEVPRDQFVEALTELVRADAGELGDAPGAALYLRPFLIASDERLGAATPPDIFRFTVIASPTPPAELGRALRVRVCDRFVRAVAGGTGDVKTAANYAAAMLGQAEAREHGCDQALWLDAFGRRWVEELGAMNLFFVDGPRLITPPLGGTVLAGITRDTVLALAAGLGLSAVVEPVDVEDLLDRCANGQITESFATGTASGTVDRHPADRRPAPQAFQL